jgi:hypothetical protein
VLGDWLFSVKNAKFEIYIYACWIRRAPPPNMSSSSSQTRFCEVARLGPVADPAQNTLVVRATHDDDDAHCRLAARHSHKLLCEHAMPLAQLTRWVEDKRTAGDDACPMCHRVGGRNNRRLRDIAVPLKDVFRDGDVPQLFDDAYVLAHEQDLRRRYGRYFLVVEWQGDNPEDSHYELYPFAEQSDTYEGFLWRLRNHPADDPQLGQRSTAYVRGYQQASQQFVMWGGKFARLVFQSA